jgi:hypothetical protein
MLGDCGHRRAMQLLPFAAAVAALTLNRQSVGFLALTIKCQFTFKLPQI